MREITIYNYDELSEEAKKYAVERYRSNHGEYLFDDWDSRNLTNYFKEYVSNEYGYEDKEFYWSLSYSQGDGVRFEGKMYDDEILRVAKRLLDEEEFNLLNEFMSDNTVRGVILGTSNHYYHYNTMEVELDSDLSSLYDAEIEELGIDVFNRLEEIVELLEDYILEDIKGISRELESIGYKEIEGHYEDDYIIELLIANEREFLEDGSLF